jgi:hypothetical protein
LIIWFGDVPYVNRIGEIWQEVEHHLESALTHLQQFSAWQEQLNDIRSMSHKRSMMNYENADEHRRHAEVCFRTEYFNLIIIEIKTNV